MVLRPDWRITHVNIVAADPTPHARVLSEAEVRALLAEPIFLRLGIVDESGWPLVHPLWHLFDGARFRLIIGKASRKASVLRTKERAYFTVDTGSGGSARGVRGRATARVIDGDVEAAVDVCRRQLLKYTGTDTGALAEELLAWARSGDLSVVDLTPLRFAAFAY
jgi:nitroimidazol reductase NimA-like FMN-containing flavoprotein (pyridoxamine 5'-phosphate oxidase superfamily)